MKWSWKDYWLKARQYIERAHEFEHTDSRFAFYSSLALEFLARAALTKIHPVLNADPRSDENLLYALGYDIAAQPRSLPAHAVFLRLEKTVDGFGKVQRELCDYISVLRNEELHTGLPAFESLKESSWLPRYYETCNVLCMAIDKKLESLLGTSDAKAAKKLIGTLNKQIEATVRSKVAAHSKVFAGRDEDEQEELRQTAKSRANSMFIPHAIEQCPACSSEGIIRGELIRTLPLKYEDETLFVDEEYLASQFNCAACGLALNNLEEISHAGLEPRFTRQTATSLHELMEPDYYEEYMNM